MTRSRGIPALLVLLLAGGALLFWLTGGKPRTLDELPARARADFLSHKHQAFEQMRLGHLEGAEADLLRCLKVFDMDPEIHRALSKVYMARRLKETPGRDTEEEDRLVEVALAGLERALALDPDNVPALMARFYIFFNPTLRRYDPDRALEDAEEVLRLAPENSGFRERLIKWLLGTTRFRRAREGKVAYDSGLGLEVAERHTEWMLDRASAGSDAQAQALYGLGVVYSYMGDFDRAVKVFTDLEGTSLSPEMSARTLEDLGFAHYRMGRYPQAAASYLRAIDVRGVGLKSLEARWLLRLAYEAMDRDPSDLEEKYLFPLPPEDWDPGDPPDLKFTEMGEDLGVAKVDGAGPSAFVDYDGDGDPDILVAGCDTYLALYRNDGDRFADVTIEAGLAEVDSGFSTNLIDHDNDGDLDIFIGRNGWSGPARNFLLENDGKGHFHDRSAASGLDHPGSGFVSLWADFDRDGDIDLYLTNGVLNEGYTNRLFRNRGDGTFEDFTAGAGLAESTRWGTIGAAAGDYDRDGDTDIFVNGRMEAPNRLYRNRGDGTFEEVAEEAGVKGDSHNGFVAFFLDHDNDAYPDILATSLAKWDFVLRGMAGLVRPSGPREVQSDAPRLYRNDRDGTFTDVTFQANLALPRGVMGAGVADLDNDGHIDLYLGTGDPDLKRLEPSILYHNRGDGTFRNLTRFTGLGHLGKGHGFTFADFDGDGDLDIYAPQGGFFHGDLWANPFYRNDGGTGNHWVHLRLRGKKSNRFAVGAAVTLRAGGMVQYREVQGGAGFGSHDSYPVEFGLGKTTEIEEVEIVWPSGHRQLFRSPPVDVLLEVVESESEYRVVTGNH